MIFKTAVTLLALATSAQAQLLQNYVSGCVPDGEFNPTTDYFPEKYEPPSIFTYNEDTDIFGERFVPHNTTDLLDIKYFGNYKIIYNKHQNVSYLLYQCGTTPPQDEIDSGRHHLVLPVPHQGGVAVTQTPQIPPLELLGRRQDIIAYVGDSQYVSSPCLLAMLEDGSVEKVFNADDPYNSTVQDAARAEFLERHPDAIIFGGPTDEAPWQDRTMQVAASQERTNVATFDWIALFAALFNLEAISNRISQETQARYDCSSTNARMIVDQQRNRRQLHLSGKSVEEERPVRRRAVQKEASTAAVEPGRQLQEGNMTTTAPGEVKILWAVHFTGYNWSVASCPQW